MSDLDSIAVAFAALLSHPACQAALSKARVAAAGDELIPLATLAEQVGTTTRVLSDEGRRGRLKIEGPRCARVVRLCERDRWLAAGAPKTKKTTKAPSKAANDTSDEREEVRAAVARAVARAAR